MGQVILDLSILETGNVDPHSGLLGNFFSHLIFSYFILAAAIWQQPCKLCFQHIPSIHGEYNFFSYTPLPPGA